MSGEPVKPKSTGRDADAYVLEVQVGYLIRQAHQRASSIFGTCFNDQQLTPTQFATLAKIADEEAVSQNRLGRLTAMDPATMKGVLGRLVKRDLISSAADPTDRRRTIWRLTSAGTDLLQLTKPAAVKTTTDTLAPLSPEERKLFLKLLKRIT
jgi:MarR family transcriptional regulator, lower aerobic nicotinate degradation pathway regulator